MQTITAQILQPYFDRLSFLYARMDGAYRQTAQALGFGCTGCPENCCETHFSHHTYIEFLYLRSALANLPSAHRREIERRTAQGCFESAGGNGPKAAGRRSMCPLNEGGRCVLYAFRPMICRLHGIPHVLQRPDGSRLTGPGCAACERICAAGHGHLLDRTAHYQAVAALELDLRRQLGLNRKIKQTVAEMILSPEPQLPPFSG
jgi:Fe-S-cluster containining protein